MCCRNAVVAVLSLCYGLILIGCGDAATPGTASGTSTSTPPDVSTFHNDNLRSGQNLQETVLTHKNVNVNTFGKIAFLTVDGKVDAQPLFLANVQMSTGLRPTLYVATEHGTVFAFDANTAEYLWNSSLLGAGESTSDTRGCDEAIAPEIGITATPVIDRTQGPNGAIYVVVMSKDATGNYHQRIHALDIANGTELFGGPREISASYPGTGDNSDGASVVFDSKQYKERAGLLLVNGVIYTTWASHCDVRPYTGWVLGYDAATLQQKYVLNLTPNGGGGGIWMSGSGPAADSAGNIYFLDGNGTFEDALDARGFPAQADFGNGFLKLAVTGGLLNVSDYFEMSDEGMENSEDIDLGSGGSMLLPDVSDAQGKAWHLAVGAGKDGNIYVVNRDSMGKYGQTNQTLYQEILKPLAGRVFSSPAYFNNTVYYGSENDTIKAFPITAAQIAPLPSSTTSSKFPYPGTTPSISANGTNDAILWAVENGYSATLHAYDATDLTKELYNSGQAPFQRDQLGPGNKFITPTVVNGKVYVGTTFGVAVYGLR
jgi:hypothetical protein